MLLLQILDLIKKYYYNDYNRDSYVINLKGHGSIVMGKDVECFYNIEMVGRNLPEKMD